MNHPMWIEGNGVVPRFRRCFTVKGKCSGKLRICGLGFHKVWVNGLRPDERFFSPSVTNYNKRVSFVEYDIWLVTGKNVLAIEVAPGWYGPQKTTSWGFHHASWLDRPKLWCCIPDIVSSDLDWKYSEGAYSLCDYRGGSQYDSRLDEANWTLPDFDDSSWKAVLQSAPPGGKMERESNSPCGIIATYQGKKISESIWDFGTNLAGVVKMTVKGTPGDHIKLEHFEKLDESGNPVLKGILPSVWSGDFQVDTYVLHGTETETWHPDYNYYGFRYARITGPSLLQKVEALAIGSCFTKTGSFTSSDKVLNALSECFHRSYRANFVGIPTDCPHREKNGWTADAHLACAAGLWNYNSVAAYKHYIQLLVDCQRESGQLPGIAPTDGWGFNWGNGPVWDFALFEIPRLVLDFYGDTEMVEKHCSAMQKYLDFCSGMSQNFLVGFGLGDWCSPGRIAQNTTEQSSTLYFYSMAKMMTRFMTLLGKDSEEYFQLSEAIRNAYLKKYAVPSESPAILSAEIAFGLRSGKDTEILANLMRSNHHHVNYGVIGSKHVLRVLSENGFHADAVLIATQPEYPGYGYWIRQHATTLWEDWDGRYSQNHVFFGDIAAWMFEFIGGIRPVQPGFTEFKLTPHFELLKSMSCHFDTRFGRIEMSWCKSEASVLLDFTVPPETVADLVLPNGSSRKFSPGHHRLEATLY